MAGLRLDIAPNEGVTLTFPDGSTGRIILDKSRTAWARLIFDMPQSIRILRDSAKLKEDRPDPCDGRNLARMVKGEL
jgi:hypothetical protein